mmetsp:Transcript_10868/g.23091  ORF Transcript_10868/g.23091 Transcript_10868/m.23091 type:complete len:249 (-) Transcript_10868:63-809(-)
MKSGPSSGAAGLQLQRHDRSTLAITDQFAVDLFAKLGILVVLWTRAHQILDGPQTVLVQQLHDVLDAQNHRRGVWQVHLQYREPLLFVHSLLRLEDLLHEELLQAFVRQVDAHLFETVELQPLEAVDVQGPNAVVGDLRMKLRIGDFVDLCHNLVKHALVQHLDDALERLACLCKAAGALDVRCASLLVDAHFTELEDPGDAQPGEAQKVSCCLKRLFRLLGDSDFCGLAAVRKWQVRQSSGGRVGAR